jgi:hypothetical protein
MIFQHTWHQVLWGYKTRTTRVGLKRVPSVGQTIAVQPGRGKKAVCRVRVVLVEYVAHARDSLVDRRFEEGFASADVAVETWRAMHGDYNGPGLVIWFTFCRRME